MLETIVGHDPQDHIAKPLGRQFRGVGIVCGDGPVDPEPDAQLLGEQAGDLVVEPGRLGVGRREREVVLIQPHHQLAGRADPGQSGISVLGRLDLLHLGLGTTISDVRGGSIFSASSPGHLRSAPETGRNRARGKRARTRATVPSLIRASSAASTCRLSSSSPRHMATAIFQWSSGT